MKVHHLPNGTFRNNADLALTHTKLSNVLKWKLHSPKVERLSFPHNVQDFSSLEKDALDGFTWIGHATFLLRINGLNILTDPHFSERASPSQKAGPKRTTQPALQIADLPHIDVVVVSHDHYDHLDRDSVIKLVNKQAACPPLFLVPLKLGEWLNKLGIDCWRELDWWDSTNFKGLHFHAVPVQHFSGRGLVQNNTLWAGWVIEWPGNIAETGASKKLFFAGDTGYSEDFKEINKRLGAMDVSLLPIGAYEPRWFMKEVHVNPEESVKIHIDLASKLSIGMHWGSFVLTDEPMDMPPRHLEQAKQKLGVPDEAFIVVDHGAVISI